MTADSRNNTAEPVKLVKSKTGQHDAVSKIGDDAAQETNKNSVSYVKLFELEQPPLHAKWTEPRSDKLTSKWDVYQRDNQKKLARNLLIFVFLPTLITAIYFAFIASDRYVSEFQLTVQRPNNDFTSVFGSLFGGGQSSSNESYVVENYVQSLPALQGLDSQLGLREHYAQDSIDYFSGMDADVTDEAFLAYYNTRVEVFNDPTTGIISVKVQAFSPDMAKTAADLLATLCEDLVNNLNEQARIDSLAFAKKELNLSEDHFRDVRMKLSSFRNREGDLDPTKSAAVITAIANSLQGKITETRVQLAQVRSYMQPNSVTITSLKSKLRALENQLNLEQKKLVNSNSEAATDKEYIDLLQEYESLILEEELARTAYQAMSQAYQASRAEASKSQYIYLVAFVPPNLPHESTEPQRIRNVSIVFILSLIMYLVGLFIWSSIREQAHV